MLVLLNKEAVLAFSHVKTVFCLLLAHIDMVGGEFRKAPPTISIGHLMPVG
jgi:hypothetical protein